MSKNELLFNNSERDSMNKLNSVSSKSEDSCRMLADNVKSQLALLELYKFCKSMYIFHNIWIIFIIDKKKKMQNLHIKTKINLLRTIKLIIMIIYSSMVFLEKPFWCYESTTFNRDLYKVYEYFLLYLYL
jgi:hypothetical protein